MNVDVLLILIVPQEWLCVLPAVESPNSSERRIDNSLQRVTLAGAPVCSLHMGRLSLATVVDNLPINIDEDLLAFQPVSSVKQKRTPVGLSRNFTKMRIPDGETV